MKQLTVARNRLVKLALVSFGFLGLSTSGCLLASGRPVLDFGEACKGDGDCASFGFCADTQLYGAVCLPQSAECALPNDPICGGYACVTRYGGAPYAFCERSCRARVDCADTHDCTDFNSKGEGICTLAP
jgi:hypothetical protein